MKNFQRILKGEIRSSVEIKDEIETLTNSGQELEANLPALEKALEKARTELLAEAPGAMGKIKRAEEAISENKNKILGISGIIKDLNVALEKALTSETIKKQAEITSERAEIDEQIAEVRLKIVESFAKSCALYENITGQNYSYLSLEFFENHKLTEALRQCIAEKADDQGASLYRQRQNLSAEESRMRGHQNT